jgi:CheY-like chemotaxis protein
MVEKHVLRVPVVDEGTLVGVISRGHVLKHSLPFASSSPRFVSSCAWCERVHDPSRGTAREKEWKDLASFLSSRQLLFSDIDLISTYCPSCLQTLQALNFASRSQSSDEEDKKHRSCLLVVDDDPSMSGLLNKALQEWGYDVLIAKNGREGLDLVERRPVDGILLDMHMPVMDGRTMLDELRWLGHHMPVLMMSGGSDERSLRQLLQEGAQGFFLKPFNLSSLQQVCRQVFSAHAEEKITETASSHSQVA